MLLQHGANPNANFSHTKPMYTTLYVIVSFPLDEYSDYVSSLIKHNADLNERNSKQGNVLNNELKLNAGITHSKMKQQKKTICTRVTVDTLPAVHSAPIVLVCDRTDTLLFKSLLPHCNILNLAACLANIATKDIFGTRRIPSERPSINLTVVQQLPPLLISECPFMSWYIYPMQSSDPKLNEYIPRYCEHWALAQQVFIEKMKSPMLTQAVFDQTYQLAFEQGMGRSYENELVFAFTAFVACEFLLAERCKNLSNPSDQKALLMKYIPDLSKQLINTQSVLLKHAPRVTDTLSLTYSRMIRGFQKWHPPQEEVVPTLSFSAGAPSAVSQTASTAEPHTEEKTKKPPTKGTDKKGKP